MTAPRVGIVMGSDSDLDILQEAAKVLDALGVAYEVTVASAHRTPERARTWVHGAEARGVRVFIAGAGGAAALPGFVASETTRPVIGVPIPTVLDGLDSLLSMVQMPRGLPVATLAIGKPGAANAGILAAQILAVGDRDLAQRVAAHRAEMAQEVEARAQKVEEAMRRDRSAAGR
jgi:phosphoribosylaminoimidazole carboxylase PurE protein